MRGGSGGLPPHRHILQVHPQSAACCSHPPFLQCTDAPTLRHSINRFLQGALLRGPPPMAPAPSPHELEQAQREGVPPNDKHAEVHCSGSDRQCGGGGAL